MGKKMLFIMTTIMAFALFVPNVMAADVKTQEEFYTAIENGAKVDIKSSLNIKLEHDVTITSKVTIGAFSGNEVSMTIDLNGHKINLNGSTAQLYVQKKGKLIVEDSTGNGLITNAGATGYNPYPVQIAGNCEINGGTLENTLSSNYALYIQNETSTCTLNNGTIINSYDKGGRAVYINKATFIMNNGKVENKAAGSDGLVPAIEGHKVIINGGTIDAAGTGITATGSNVEITGGTIDAGWFGLHTRYATVNPAEGKQVNINAGRAAIIAYSTPTDGKGNKIYGGTFVAPELMESKYVSDATNVEIHGGVFTSDVSDYVVDGKYAEKVGTNYEIKEYSQNVEITPVDPSKEVEDTTVGLTQNEETEATLMESLEGAITSNATLKDAVNNNNVVVVVDIASVKEDELDDEIVGEFEAVSKKLVVADYFDINVLVNDNNNNKLGIIPELTKDIELVIVLPEKYINTDKNVNRTYYVIREHDGKVEILKDVEVSKDGKSIIFKSNKFSTYALAYEDKVNEDESIEDEAKKEELPPKTGDINLSMFIGTILISAIGLVIVSKKMLAKNN